MDKKLIYIGDPMCSWCWGFSPVIQALAEQCLGRGDVSIVVGGLHPGTTEVQDQERKDFLRHHWKEVNQYSGQPFSFGLLDRDDFTYDTEPACRAVVIVKEIRGDIEALHFFSKLQHAFYVKNDDITQQDILTKIAEDSGIDCGIFSKRLLSEEMKRATIADFDFSRRLGATGFPTVLVKDENGYAYLTNGYQPHEVLQPILEQWLNS